MTFESWVTLELWVTIESWLTFLIMGGQAHKQTNRHTHINTMTWPGLGAGRGKNYTNTKL